MLVVAMLMLLLILFGRHSLWAVRYAHASSALRFDDETKVAAPSVLISDLNAAVAWLVSAV